MNVCGSAYESKCMVDGMYATYGSGLSITIITNIIINIIASLYYY